MHNSARNPYLHSIINGLNFYRLRPGEDLMKLNFSKVIVFVLAISLNACLLEQVLSACADFGHDIESYDDTAHAAPSHKHDSDDHENAFCCDNSQTSFVVRSSNYHIDLFKLNKSMCYLNFDALEAVASERYSLSPLISIKYPITPRTRDRYALCSLLHAPPRESSFTRLI